MKGQSLHHLSGPAPPVLRSFWPGTWREDFRSSLKSVDLQFTVHKILQNLHSTRALQKHVCTLHAPNEKRHNEVRLSRLEARTMRHLANAHSATGPGSGNTGRLFLLFGGNSRADGKSNCPIDRMYFFF